MTTSTANFPRRHRAAPPSAKPIQAFHAPPLRPVVVDIARDLATVRQHRRLLTQRVGAVWIRGHARN